MDTNAVASENNDSIIIIYSEGFNEPFEVSLDVLDPVKEEEGSTSALIRGIASRFKELGFTIGGFNAYITSNVLVGSGLSSSASIEVLIGTILNSIYNRNSVSPEMIAIIGQYAENNFFGKPCGLMDQIACSVGGVIAIDFKDPQNPKITKIDFDLSKEGYDLIIVNTGDDHADLTEDYAAIPSEMNSVAKLLGGNVCRDISKDELYKNINDIRKTLGDRAVLRAMHFLDEQVRVEKQIVALKENKFNEFLELVKQSGNSSFKLLQNIFSVNNPSIQGLSLALAITESFLQEKAIYGDNATRVHGGGFAGTIQVFLKKEFSDEYKNLLESVFGDGSVKVLTIRSYGSFDFSS